MLQQQQTSSTMAFALFSFLSRPSPDELAQQELHREMEHKRARLDQLIAERAQVATKVSKEHQYPNYFSENQTRLIMLDRQIDRLNASLDELEARV